uniref:phosphatidylinositol-3,4,5-trisphosphate 5-phosphatase n=4 Tax=Xenopus tropicalis TaxID=8364 RepID=A0A803JPD5_XENTR
MSSGCGGALTLAANMALPWYHRDLSRAAAEELLAKAGRDGSFLVRDSESVTGAYALCVLYQKHVHTYRILPDEEDYLAVQTSQGVQVRRFKTLGDLIALYLQPNQGMVCTLLYPVEREKDVAEDRDYSDGEDEKPPLPPRSASASFSGAQSPPACGQDASFTESCPNGLSTISHEYLKGSYALDLEAVRSGATNLPHLNKTLVVSCKRLHGEVDKVLSGLEILSKIFDQQSSTSTVSKILQQCASQPGEQELENLVMKLSVLKDFLSNIEKKALKALQDMSCSAQSAPTSQSSRKCKSVPVQSFEVKLDMADLTKIVKSQKYSLNVDVEGGKLVVMKKVKESQEDWNTFTHEKIRQLIKSQRVPCKLGIVFEKEKDKTQRKDFIFVSARKREAFCQLLQLMKNKHSNQDEPDMISVFIGTWNMGSVPPQKNITSWFCSKGLGKTLDDMAVTIPHDIYVFGTQENSMGDKEWVDFLRGVLKECTEIEYRPVAMQSLWNIKIVVLVRPEHENRISHISTSSVKTGIANTLGNKGAVGISFMFNGTSFGFVNCHLTSGNEKTSRRNQNYLDILRLLSLGDKQLNSFDISLRFTHLFWFGDLNYRLDMDVQEILNFISRKEFDPLLKVDQLNLEKEKNKIFLRFNEEELTFPPTYRYERGSRDTYVWHKHKPTGVRTNVPSWCDRILWKCYPETHIICNSYGCTDDIMTSDHSPVFASFEVGVTSQFVSKKGLLKPSDQACIEFESIEAIVKTASRTKFFIEFYSGCLEEFRKSSENDSQSIDNINFLKVQWSSRQLPTVGVSFSGRGSLGAGMDCPRDGATVGKPMWRLSHLPEHAGNWSLAPQCFYCIRIVGFMGFMHEWGPNRFVLTKGWLLRASSSAPGGGGGGGEGRFNCLGSEPADCGAGEFSPLYFLCRQLNPIVSEIEYLQDQHLLLTVKSMDGYESYGECVIALKSMIGSTAQQFLTSLSHRGEETGNIRGSMKVRVPTERMGTRERLYEWISIDKDETGAVKGKPPCARPNHDYTKPVGRKPLPADAAPNPSLAKLFEEPEKGLAHGSSRPSVPLPSATKEDLAATRAKGDPQAEGDGVGMKNSFNNPAYYVLEGVPHHMLPPEGQTSALAPHKNKVPITVSAPHAEKRRQQQYVAPRGEETSSDEDCGTLNLPPPDFPPPPLPKSAELEMMDNPFYMSASELHSRHGQDASQKPGASKGKVGVTFSEPHDAKFPAKSQPRPPMAPPQSYLAEHPGTAHGTQDDRSCSVLQMARTLSEVDYSGGKADPVGREVQGRASQFLPGKGKMELPPRCIDYGRQLAFPQHCIRESIQEDLAEEAMYQGGRSSSSLRESSVGEWLRAIGLERYEEGLIQNGWDDLEFLSDIVEEDLEEAGVLDPTHKRVILESLQARK